MAVRYRKSINLGNGTRINFSKSGIGLSFGTKGFRYTINSSGRTTTTFGIPNTGLSYSKTTSLHKPRKKAASAIAQANAQAELKNNQKEVSQYLGYMNQIESFHKSSIEPVNWMAIAQTPPPFEKGETGPREKAALDKFAHFKTNLFERMIKSDGSRRKEKLHERISVAHEEDLEEWNGWQGVHELATGILEHDTDAYPVAMETYAPLEGVAQCCSDFDFLINSPEEVTVEFDAHGKDVIPAQEKSLTKTGKLSIKALSKTKYFDYLQDYVCSCAVRVARDLFAVLPVDKVIVNVKEDVLNTATGYGEKECILSVRFTRAGFENVNFEFIDPSDFVESFEHHMKFAKTAGFRPVPRI